MIFAEIDSSNVVLQVIEAEQADINTRLGTWVQADMAGVSPKNVPSIGYSWDVGANAFYPPKPHASWVLNSSGSGWAAPVACPQDGHIYDWDEASVAWVVRP